MEFKIVCSSSQASSIQEWRASIYDVNFLAVTSSAVLSDLRCGVLCLASNISGNYSFNCSMNHSSYCEG